MKFIANFIFYKIDITSSSLKYTGKIVLKKILDFFVISLKGSNVAGWEGRDRKRGLFIWTYTTYRQILKIEQTFYKVKLCYLIGVISLIVYLFYPNFGEV